MELSGRKRMMLFSGSANPALADEVTGLLGIALGGVERDVFANGEIYVRYTESVRGADCFVLQSHSHRVNFHIMEQLIMIDDVYISICQYWIRIVDIQKIFKSSLSPSSERSDFFLESNCERNSVSVPNISVGDEGVVELIG